MVPREFPCSAISWDRNNIGDPFSSNHPITADFYDLTSWKNNRNGAIVGTVGDIRFHNFKTADNILAGIEFERIDASIRDNLARVQDTLIIGKSANTEAMLEGASPRGIITPRSEYFTIQDVRFYNFDWNTAAAIGDCSHCFHDAATDSGARTVKTSGLYFDSTVTKRIKY